MQPILFVGNRRGYKNFRVFLIAMSIVFQQRHDTNCLCVGEPFMSDEIAAMDFLRIRHRMMRVEASDSDMPLLYRNSGVFVFPSYYEGFGLPILEALNEGCPVACSDIPVFHEVAKSRAVYFDPHDACSIAEAVGTALDCEREFWFPKNNTNGFSWEKTAKETIDIYNGVI